MPSNMRSINLCLKHFLERLCALTANVTSLKLTWKEIKVLNKQFKKNDLFPLAFQQRGTLNFGKSFSRFFPVLVRQVLQRSPAPSALG